MQSNPQQEGGRGQYLMRCVVGERAARTFALTSELPM